MARNFSQKQRETLWNGDKRKCQICGRRIRKNETWHADHIHPYSAGGETEIWNGQVTCSSCNLHKSDNYQLECSGWDRSDWRYDDQYYND